MARESWTVKNHTSKNLSIGDLPRVPVMRKNMQINLLKFATKSDINQSVNLKQMLDIGWLKLTKTKDKVKTTLSKTKGETGVHSIEENELKDYSYSKEETYSKEEVDDLVGCVSEVITVTDNYTPGDNDQVILVDASSKDITITLPPAVDYNNKTFFIKKIDSSINNMIIDGNENETVDENETITTNVQYLSLHVACDGANWWII